MSYSIKRECWNEKTFNGYTDNPYWRIDAKGFGFGFGLTDDGLLWSVEDLDITPAHEEMIKMVIYECKLKIELK